MIANNKDEEETWKNFPFDKVNSEYRKMLTHKRLTRNNAVGYDCDGWYIKIGDCVEVVKEEIRRKGKSEYSYCSAGKKGKIVGKNPNDFNNWFVDVEFVKDDGKKITVRCLDYSLMKCK